jgi:Ca2+-binding RTX toxin-like protein
MRHTTRRRIAALASFALLAFAVTPVLGAVLSGTSGPDHLVGTATADKIRGYGGADYMIGKGGPDYIDGGRGNDRLLGGLGQGVDHLYGRSGNDRLFPGDGDDYVSGGFGDDLVRAADYDLDTIICGDGWDTVYYDLKDFRPYGGVVEDSVAADCEDRIAVGTPTPLPSASP